MRRLTLPVLVAISLAASACGPQRPINAEYEPFVAAALRQANENWFTALRTRNTTLLDPLLSGDVSVTWPDGTGSTKASLLQDLQSGRARFDSVTAAQSRTRVIGQSAIITGQATLHSQRDGQPVAEPIVYTALYGWTGSAWQMLAWQGTRRAE